MGNAFLYGSAGGGTCGALTVTAPANVTVTVTGNGKTYTKSSGSSGSVTFKPLKAGTYTVTIASGSQTASQSVTVKTDYTASLSFNKIPGFTYSGSYKIVDDSGNTITTTQGNWKIRFLTSGTLKFTSLNGAAGGIDVFLVGGGGGGGGAVDYSGGGGGGYTKTSKAVSVSTGKSYSIVVGAGGGVQANGGNSSAFGFTAAGGKCGGASAGGAGGSGGGKGACNGGSNGGNGSDGSGVGQGTTTREFGLSSGTLYAGGGGGGTVSGTTGTGGSGGGAKGGASASANTGGGGGGGWSNSGSGGSGIVIIRNKR